VTYYWDADFGNEPDDPGIIRLVVMPYREGPSGASIDNWRNAMAEGRFVAVALDNEPPGGTSGGDAVFTISGESNIDTSGVYNYNNSTYKNFTISANFTKIADNGMEGGIRQTSATRDKPWTMDSQSDIEWQYKITGAAPSSWFPLTENDKSVDLTTTGLPSSTTPLNIEVRYRDKLENTSVWIDTEKKIRYFSPSFTSVSTYSATYNENLNTITVAWTTPGNMTGVELQIDDRLPQNMSGTGSKTYPISNVPHIDASRVTSGEPVTNVVGYTISLTAYNDYGKAAPVVYKIWNIPDMTVNNSSLAEEIKSQADLAIIATGAGNANRQYVLTQNITLNGRWTPIYDFRGKFYGNGHTITIGSDFSFYLTTGSYGGIFGTVSGNGEIHDLCVNYNSDISVDVNVGGLVGNIPTSSISVNIINCIVGGIGTLKVSDGIYFGGICGNNDKSSSTIKNNYCSLNIEIIDSHRLEVFVGGIVGNNDGSCSNNISVGSIIVRHTSETAANNLYVGGIAGYSSGSFNSCEFNGTIEVNDDGSETIYVGGIVGYQKAGAKDGTNSLNTSLSISNCAFNTPNISSIKISSSKAQASYVGGIVGQAHNVKINDCWFFIEEDIYVNSVSGEIHFGGIGGYLGYGTIIKNCNYLPAFGYMVATSSGMICVGGIAGSINYCTIGINDNNHNTIKKGVALENCRTGEKTNVDPSGSGNLYAGSLVGYSNGGSGYVNTITKCISSFDNVQATSSGSGDIYAGGLVGNASYTSIKNCYNQRSEADNTITADKSDATGNVYTGGIVGYSSNSTVQFTISNCSVTAKSKSTTGVVRSGGIVGYHASGTFANNAALGSDVIAQGGGSRSAGRIYGSATGTKNYAIDTMRVRENVTYGDTGTGATVTSSDYTSAHGKGTPLSEFRRADFWSDIGADGLAFNTDGTGTGIGNLVYIWDFNIVTGRGYPRLLWELE